MSASACKDTKSTEIHGIDIGDRCPASTRVEPSPAFTNSSYRQPRTGRLVHQHAREVPEAVGREAEEELQGEGDAEDVP